MAFKHQSSTWYFEQVGKGNSLPEDENTRVVTTNRYWSQMYIWGKSTNDRITGFVLTSGRQMDQHLGRFVSSEESIWDDVSIYMKQGVCAMTEMCGGPISLPTSVATNGVAWWLVSYDLL